MSEEKMTITEGMTAELQEWVHENKAERAGIVAAMDYANSLTEVNLYGDMQPMLTLSAYLLVAACMQSRHPMGMLRKMYVHAKKFIREAGKPEAKEEEGD